MEEEQRSGKGLFYGVIGVATLIVAIIGATFAWFTATANSGDAQEVVKAGTLAINYADGNKVLLQNMKPATFAQVKTAYARTGADTCKEADSPNENVCSKYTFTVTNTGTIQAVITSAITLGANPFTANALRYALVEGSDISAATEITYAAGTAFNEPMLSAQTLAPNGTKTYTVVFWLDGATSTNDDQNKSLSGTVAVSAVQTNQQP